MHLVLERGTHTSASAETKLPAEEYAMGNHFGRYARERIIAGSPIHQADDV